MADDHSSSASRVKASLAHLAESDESAIIEQADAAIEEVDSAAEFVQTVGLERLEVAVEAVEDPQLEARGRSVVETFRQFQRAANPSQQAADRHSDQFHYGRGTNISEKATGTDR